jgi:acetyl-CoA acetyltransferase
VTRVLQIVRLGCRAKRRAAASLVARWRVDVLEPAQRAAEVQEVIVGNVLSAGLGQNVARQAAIGAGLSPAVGATTVNKVCGSSLKAVMLAAQAIKCGDAEVIVAAGAENMSAAPYLLAKARNGYRLGNGELIDSMIRDGLWDVYNNVHVGTCGDRCAEKYQFSRQQQDDYAVASFKRAIAAQEQGPLAAAGQDRRRLAVHRRRRGRGLGRRDGRLSVADGARNTLHLG